MVARQDPDQLSQFPDAGNMLMTIIRIGYVFKTVNESLIDPDEKHFFAIKKIMSHLHVCDG